MSGPVAASADTPIPPEPPTSSQDRSSKTPSGWQVWCKNQAIGGWSLATANLRAERRLLESITEVVPIADSTDLDRKGGETDLLLKRWLSTKVVRWMGRQLIAVNVLFFLYAWLGVKWDVPPAAISAWLGATVIQIIGIVYIIARYLFPVDDSPHSPTRRAKRR